MSSHAQDPNSAASHSGEDFGGSQRNQHSERSQYLRFALMILASASVMYVVMYLNTYSVDHVYWSWTDSS